MTLALPTVTCSALAPKLKIKTVASVEILARGRMGQLQERLCRSGQERLSLQGPQRDSKSRREAIHNRSPNGIRDVITFSVGCTSNQALRTTLWVTSRSD